MDLRNEFEQILRQYGYPVLVVRQNKKLRCSCWNEKTQEADRECPVCFGLGFTPIVEKHTAREEATSPPQTFPFLAQGSQIGQMSVPGKMYYFKWTAELAPQDLIIDVDWTEQGKPIYTGRGIYEISEVDAERFNRGEIIYYNVYCKDQPVEKEIRGIRITNVNGIVNYEIAMEG